MNEFSIVFLFFLGSIVIYPLIVAFSLKGVLDQLSLGYGYITLFDICKKRYNNLEIFDPKPLNLLIEARYTRLAKKLKHEKYDYILKNIIIHTFVFIAPMWGYYFKEIDFFILGTMFIIVSFLGLFLKKERLDMRYVIFFPLFALETLLFGCNLVIVSITCTLFYISTVFPLVRKIKEIWDEKFQSLYKEITEEK